MTKPSAPSARLLIWVKVLLPPLVILAGIAVAALMIALKPKQPKQEPKPVYPRVETFTVQPYTGRIRIPSEGTVRPLRRTRLTAQVAGEVIYVADSFYEGGRFCEGEVLLRLNPLPYETALAEAQARLAAARAAFLKEQENARQARMDWERLHQAGQPSPLVLREPQLEQARAEQAATRAAVAVAEQNLRYTEVTAPYAGRVLSQQVEIGQSLPGPSVVLGEIYSTSALEISVPLHLDDLALLRPHESEEPPVQARVLTTIGGQKHVWQGFLDRTAADVDERSRMMDVIVRVEPPFTSDGGWPLTPGMFVSVELVGPSVPGAARIPRQALQPDDLVYRLDATDRLHAVKVEVLRSGAEEVLVSGSVSAGDRLCLTPLLFFVEGMQVEPAS